MAGYAPRICSDLGLPSPDNQGIMEKAPEGFYEAEKDRTAVGAPQTTFLNEEQYYEYLQH